MRCCFESLNFRTDDCKLTVANANLNVAGLQMTNESGIFRKLWPWETILHSTQAASSWWQSGCHDPWYELIETINKRSNFWIPFQSSSDDDPKIARRGCANTGPSTTYRQKQTNKFNFTVHWNAVFCSSSPWQVWSASEVHCAANSLRTVHPAIPKSFLSQNWTALWIYAAHRSFWNCETLKWNNLVWFKRRDFRSKSACRTKPIRNPGDTLSWICSSSKLIPKTT